jgi:hypothetical protein
MVLSFSHVCVSVRHAIYHCVFKEGIRDDPLFRSYREQREQMVQKNGQESEPGVVKMGVVQGGVLSPTLLNIFVNGQV